MMLILLFEVLYTDDDIKTSSQFLLSGGVGKGIQHKKIAILFLRVLYTTHLHVKSNLLAVQNSYYCFGS